MSSDREQHRVGVSRGLPWEPPSPVSRSVANELLRAAGQGDVDALRTLYDETAAVVFGMFSSVLGEPAQAAERTREVYLHLWRTAPQFASTGGDAYSLLLRTVRRGLVGPVHDRCAAAVPPEEGRV